MKADYDKKVELKRSLSKTKKNPIGVIVKDPALKCELSASLKPLPISPRDQLPTKNVSIMEEEQAPYNISKIRSAYYNYMVTGRNLNGSKMMQTET